MRFKIGSRLAYQTQSPVSFVFNVEAQSFPGQRIEQESLVLSPDVPVDRWTSAENGNRYFRITPPAGLVTLAYDAIVDLAPSLGDAGAVTEIPPAELPLAALPNLFPSRYCQSDRLERFARSTFGDLPPGYARVNGICNWIYEYVTYEGGVSDAMTSAFDIVTMRAGVCRDFAHLAISLCRALGIPARYVSAYAFRLDPPDFHAVFEAYLQGPAGPGWYIFDATRMADPAGLVRIGIGHDAAEVAFCTAFGPMMAEKPEVWIEALEPARAPTVHAVRPEAGG
jgi:transglutaminase-like putative cysteine protease